MSGVCSMQKYQGCVMGGRRRALEAVGWALGYIQTPRT